MQWFEETLHSDWRQSMPITRVLFRDRSEHQDLIVFETPLFGRVLALDGVVQTTLADEFIYHETMAHIPIMAHGAARDILIIGGGDGGTLEEALKHADVRRATQVEIDPSVIELSREHLAEIGKGAFDDPRTRLVFADGARFVAECEERFDVVIVDSTDPIGPGAVLFGEQFYADCRRVLAPGGVMITQGGNPFVDRCAQLRTSIARLTRQFEDVTFLSAAIPSYIGGVMAFGWAATDRRLREVDLATLESRALPSGLRHYTPAVHRASFAQPPWLAEAVRAG
jgi:spermidine synthase